MALRSVPQLALDETTVTDADLEAALESRQRSKEEAASARGEFTTADNVAKALIERLELDEGPVRIGRFRITRSVLKGRSVTFETQDKPRVQIALVEDD
jgi:hypothetical protein